MLVDGKNIAYMNNMYVDHSIFVPFVNIPYFVKYYTWLFSRDLDTIGLIGNNFVMTLMHVTKSDVQSKNAVCANITHNRYFH